MQVVDVSSTLPWSQGLLIAQEGHQTSPIILSRVTVGLSAVVGHHIIECSTSFPLDMCIHLLQC